MSSVTQPLAIYKNCLDNSKLYGRSSVCLASVGQKRWKLRGDQHSNFEQVKKQFESLGFALIQSDEYSNQITIYPPRGWKVVRDQRFEDFFVLAFMDPHGIERAGLSCKSAEYEKYMYSDIPKVQQGSEELVLNRTLENDIWKKILDRLNPKERMKARCVSRLWKIKVSHYMLSPELYKYRQMFETCCLASSGNFPREMEPFLDLLTGLDSIEILKKTLRQILDQKRDLFVSIVSDIRANLTNAKLLKFPKYFDQTDYELIAPIQTIKQNPNHEDWVTLGCFVDDILEILKKNVNFHNNLLTLINGLPEDHRKKTILIQLSCFIGFAGSSKDLFDEAFDRSHPDWYADITSSFQGLTALQFLPTNPQRALEIADQISEIRVKSLVMEKAFHAIYRKSPLAAKLLAKRIPFFDTRIRVACFLALESSKGDEKKFYADLHELVDVKERVQAVVEVILEKTKKDYKLALKHAEHIPCAETRAEVKSQIEFESKIVRVELVKPNLPPRPKT